MPSDTNKYDTTYNSRLNIYRSRDTYRAKYPNKRKNF